MTSSIDEEIKEIKMRLDALFAISQNILALLLKEEEILPDEEKAVRKKEEIIDEKTLIEVLKE